MIAALLCIVVHITIRHLADAPTEPRAVAVINICVTILAIWVIYLC
ncbi:hypothetical protein [Ralstonia phage phiRSL1]|uniref:Uncharacterized protein n=1 Tax=Ralstonia phage phiRSL1 TaxID=1980924 RepID=B2ZXM5_9CAUD|nr:hypothetical protein RSL1_ORF006 [Ralstonia phage phiRSL1]BAG41451.1 hypothetical protein [Ralstonia phage phiRSL1]